LTRKLRTLCTLILVELVAPIAATAQQPGDETTVTTREFIYGPSYLDDHLAEIGHQGLFFTTYADPSTPDTPAGDLPLTPYAEGTYHNRNRDYAPRLGRFLQRDPNATAQPLITAAYMNGAVIDTLINAFDLASHFGDGSNTYVYVDSNPLRNRDALGLDFDDDIDDTIAGLIGERVAAAEHVQSILGAGLNTAAVLGGLAFSLVPGSDALALLATLARGDSIDETDIIIATSSIAGGAIIGKIVGKLVKARKAYKGRAALKQLSLPERQLQKKWKHARAFGIDGNYNVQNAEKFADAISDHVARATDVVPGTYRNQSGFLFSINRNTKLIVIQDSAGAFVSGWKLGDDQLKYALQGTLGGG
jgi:hypothetical protein